MSDRPNILILMTDQQRADCLSVADHSVVRTPNMDRLAAEGTRFERCYTSCPVCMPARSTFASGQFCHNHGQWFNYGSLHEEDQTYMKALRESGYHTAHIGKSHLFTHGWGHLRESTPFMNALGFDDVLEVTGPRATVNTDSIMTDHWKSLGILDIFRNDYLKRYKAGDNCATWPSPMPEGETLDDFVGRTAVEYLSAYDLDEPFCAFVGFGGPHEPWDPPVSWAEKYAGVPVPEPLPESEVSQSLSPVAREYHEKIRYHKHISHEQAQEISRLYYSKISHVDEWFGLILDALEKKGVLDNTFILFWSDHGERLADRGGLFKQVFYDESARVPLIVRRTDGMGEGNVSDSLCGTADMTATICDVAGVDIVGHGSSLLPLTLEPDVQLQDVVFSEILHAGSYTTMVRTDRHKLVVDENCEALQLFDMQEDPKEMVNLAGHKSFSDIEFDMRSRLLRWHMQTRTDKKPKG